MIHQQAEPAFKSDPAHPRSTTEASQKPKIEPVVRIANNWLGVLLDRGKPSAAAIRLLAAKLDLGNTLNEIAMRKHYGISRRQFQTALRLVVSAEVLHRQQHGQGFAVETLNKKSDGYVVVPVSLLKGKSPYPAALVAVVRLSPRPMTLAAACARIGITASGTRRSLIEAVRPHIESAVGPNGKMWVARPGVTFEDLSQNAKNVPAKNVPAKFDPTHIELKEVQSTERRPALLKATPPQTACGASGTTGFAADAGGGRLTDWKLGTSFDVNLPSTKSFENRITHDTWADAIAYVGRPVPEHLTRPEVLRQVREIVAWLDSRHAGLPSDGLLRSIVCVIAEATADGDTIRSLAFLAQRMDERLGCGSDDYVFAAPLKLPRLFREASTWSPWLLNEANKRGVPTRNRWLNSPAGVSDLAVLADEVGWPAIKHVVERKQVQQPDEKVLRWAWWRNDAKAAKERMDRDAQTKRLNRESAERRKRLKSIPY